MFGQASIEDQLEELIKLTRTNLVNLGRGLLPDKFNLKPSPLHYKLSGAMVDSSTSTAMAFPREFGKSTYAWEVMAMHNVLHQKYRYIMFITSTTSMSEDMFANVKASLKGHPLIKSLIKIQKETANRFFFTINGEKFFMACYGGGQNLRGKRFEEFRPDLIIIDDLESTESVRSPDQRKKLKDWFFADVVPLGKEARFFMVGTMLHEDCLLAELIRNPLEDAQGEQWKTFQYGVIDDQGEPTWPEKYDEAWINAKRKQYISRGQLYRFNTEYMNVVVTREDRTFDIDRMRFYSQQQYQAVSKSGLDIITVVDPGLDANADHDPSVIWTSAMDPEGNMWVLDVVRKHMVKHDLLDEIVKAYRKWSPRDVFIEAVAAQTWLLQDLENGHWPGGVIIPVQKIDHTQIRMGKLRIYNLESMFHHRKVFVPATAEFWPDLCDELITFPRGRHDDILDCQKIGTPVITEVGVKPIEEVTIQDRVLTREGYKRVLKAWCKGTKPIIEKYGLSSTPDHKVWTDTRGWVELDCLTDDDIIHVCVKVSNLKDELTTGIPRLSKRTTEITTNATTSGKKPLDCSTEIYGRSITAQSQKGITSTTMTTTTTTTLPTTWCVYPPSNTGQNIEKLAQREQAPQNIWPISTGSVEKPQKQDESALIVSVRCADWTSILESTQANTAIENVTSTQPVLVFDLAVEDCPEFFANGVLIHNCFAYAKMNHRSYSGAKINAEAILNAPSSTVF